MSQLWLIVCKNIILTLVHLLVLLYEFFINVRTWITLTLSLIDRNFNILTRAIFCSSLVYIFNGRRETEAVDKSVPVAGHGSSSRCGWRKDSFMEGRCEYIISSREQAKRGGSLAWGIGKALWRSQRKTYPASDLCWFLCTTYSKDGYDLNS